MRCLAGLRELEAGLCGRLSLAVSAASGPVMPVAQMASDGCCRSSLSRGGLGLPSRCAEVPKAACEDLEPGLVGGLVGCS